ncbi:uncharacterized protein PFLUO_LOCUS2588 [Penicillium psychrofluorescens]|uniref:uncharacterized protein n=1 Tax=Penicillium psychrofluorescens TaxID=3158075 RepID=UPI003CCE451E
MHVYLSLALFAISAIAAPSAPHPQGDPFSTFPFNPSGSVGSMEMEDSPMNDKGNDMPYGLGKGATGAQVASSALHLNSAQSTPAPSAMDVPDQNFDAPMEMPLPPMPDGTEMPMSSAVIESPSIPQSFMMSESSSMTTMAKPAPKATHKHEHEPMTSQEHEMKPTTTHAAPMHETTAAETQHMQVPATHATHAVKTMVTHPAKAANIHHEHMKVASSSSNSDRASSSSSSATPAPSPSAGLSDLLNGIPVVGSMLGGLLGGA